MSVSTPHRSLPPSLTRQKTYITENSMILDTETRKTILRLVMMEVGEVGTAIRDGEEVQLPVVLENQATREVNINLDHIDNPDVILHIYNIVSNRRASLNEPASTR